MAISKYRQVPNTITYPNGRGNGGVVTNFKDMSGFASISKNASRERILDFIGEAPYVVSGYPGRVYIVDKETFDDCEPIYSLTFLD
jgi:hypothetical protein